MSTLEKSKDKLAKELGWNIKPKLKQDSINDTDKKVIKHLTDRISDLESQLKASKDTINLISMIAQGKA